MLKQEGIGGVAVPESHFVQNPDLASTGFETQVFLRIHGAATGGTPGRPARDRDRLDGGAAESQQLSTGDREQSSPLPISASR